MSLVRLRITDELSMDAGELRWRTSTSRGPGGQHVNRTQTRVTVLFDVEKSASLNEEQRARIRERLGYRIASDGTLRASCQRHRSQALNREGAVERLTQLLADALREEAERKPTQVPRAARQRRLEQKRQRGQTKRLRRSPSGED